MLQYTPLTANMSEGANATAALTQLLMLQLLHQHQPNANQQDETFDQRQCWREILEEMHQKEQQCKMDVNLRKLAMMNKHHYDSRTVLPPCLRQLVIEDELLNILKRRYLSAAGIEAAKSGNTTELKMLLDGGLLTDVTDSDGATMLHHAAKGNQFGVVSLLLKSGANPSPVAFGWNGQTPLNNAAYRGYLQVIKLLVRFKANLDAQTKSGNTPLHDSAFNGYLTCFKFLIMSGANPSLTNSDGKTPRDVAVERGQFKIVQWLDSVGY